MQSFWLSFLSHVSLSLPLHMVRIVEVKSLFSGSTHFSSLWLYTYRSGQSLAAIPSGSAKDMG